MRLNSETVNKLYFDPEIVPTFYQWSGYAKDINEFKSCNFLQVEVSDGSTAYICSDENGVGLGDYLANYILKQDVISEMENVYSPGYDYWFFQAWEASLPFYEDLHEWVQKIVEFLIEEQYIFQVRKGNPEYFVFSDLAKYEEQDIPISMATHIEKICEDCLLRFFIEELDDYGPDDVPTGEGGDWAVSILQKAITEWESVEND